MRQYNDYYKIASDKEKEFVGNLIHIQPNDISLLFFRNDNINRINNNLRKEIIRITYEKYGKKIEIQPQKKHLLITIMRYIYLKNITNTGEVDEQIKALNDKVMELIVPTAIQGLIHRIKYINDYNRIKPMSLPINSNKNNKITLPSLSSTFF